MKPPVDGRTLHPILAAAAEGELPDWVRMTPGRREHAARVADLLASWARSLEMRPLDRDRWVAAGWLHDALKDGDTDALLDLVEEGRRDLPEPVLHGPAAAARLAREGVDDGPVLEAVAWHTLGHPALDSLGMAVYCADFLEPGRDIRRKWRKKLRDRMPGELEEVTRRIARARIEHLLKRRRPVRPETVAFWNRLAGEGDPWARASEL